MTADETISVSPYLLRPLRSYEQAQRDRAELRLLRERALQGARQGHAAPGPAAPGVHGNGD